MSATPTLDLRDRDATFAALGRERFDVLVAGGGILGAGIARDASLRGLRVALVEARDLASGTSSASSKILHGGLHYLVSGELRIVRETVRERQVMRRIAPHLARPLPFLVPRTSRRSLVAARAALHAYEWLGDVRPDERHMTLEPHEIAEREPLVRVDDVAGAVLYPELLTDDARLVVANARAAGARGAVIATWCPVIGLGPGVVEVRDALDERRETRVEARVIVNATGPWTESTTALEGAARAPHVRLRKGIHLVVRRSRLPIHRAVVLREPTGRVVFAVPRGNFVYLGTTDTPYDAPDHAPRVDASDVRYVLDCAQATFPAADLGPHDVTAAWAGLRPLVASGRSRRHRLHTSPFGTLSVIGGKLTGYRRIAAEVVDECLARLGRRAGPSTTADEPLPGGDVTDLDGVEQALRGRGLAAADAERLARLYGSEAQTVAGTGALVDSEVEHAVTHEGALRLEDWWARRSARACFDSEPDASLPRGARKMALLLEWSEARREREIASCREARAATLRACREPRAAS